MSKTIYWAVKLDDTNRDLLLKRFPAKHENVFAEHMTVVFRPSDLDDSKLQQRMGEKIPLTIVGYAEDDKGQAVVVECDGIDKIGSGIKHITISCASGTKPVYSGTLLQGGYNKTAPFAIAGTIARFTGNGWEAN